MEGGAVMKRVNYYISEPLIERLKRLAVKRDALVSELVRAAISQYLDREEKKIKKR